MILYLFGRICRRRVPEPVAKQIQAFAFGGIGQSSYSTLANLFSYLRGSIQYNALPIST